MVSGFVVVAGGWAKAERWGEVDGDWVVVLGRRRGWVRGLR